MLSLDNAFTHDEVAEFDTRVKRFLDTGREIEYTVEPKYDGLAIELTYKNGLLDRTLASPDPGVADHPAFRYVYRPLDRILAEGALVDAGWLAAAAVLLFALGYLAFIRYDVR